MTEMEAPVYTIVSILVLGLVLPSTAPAVAAETADLDRIDCSGSGESPAVVATSTPCLVQPNAQVRLIAGPAPDRGGCITLETSPPGATVDPGCRPVETHRTSSSSTHAFSHLDAVLEGASAWVNWTYAGQVEDPSQYRIFRGTHPSLLHAIAVVDGNTTSFEDHQALLSGEALWYAVEAVGPDGVSETSRPVPVGLHASAD